MKPSKKLQMCKVSLTFESEKDPGGHSREVCVELCRRGLQTPTLFRTKIAHFTTLFKTGDTTFWP